MKSFSTAFLTRMSPGKIHRLVRWSRVAMWTSPFMQRSPQQRAMHSRSEAMGAEGWGERQRGTEDEALVACLKAALRV